MTWNPTNDTLLVILLQFCLENKACICNFLLRINNLDACKLLVKSESLVQILIYYIFGQIQLIFLFAPQKFWGAIKVVKIQLSVITSGVYLIKIFFCH